MTDDFRKEFATQQENDTVEDKTYKNRKQPNHMNGRTRKQWLSGLNRVHDESKSIAQIEHLRHRSFNNFITNALSLLLPRTVSSPQKSLPLM